MGRKEQEAKPAKGEFQQLWLERVHSSLVHKATFGPDQRHLDCGNFPYVKCTTWPHWSSQGALLLGVGYRFL